MKTIEELYNEVMASDELKKEFLSLKPEEIEGFAEKYGCKATLDEIKAYITEKNSAQGEVSDNELEQVAGGKSVDKDETIFSVLTIGLGCAGAVVQSLIDGDVGTAIEGEGMLCQIDGKPLL